MGMADILDMWPGPFEQTFVLHSMEATHEVDQKIMIRIRYNRIPFPSPDTIRETNTTNQDGIK